MASAQTESSSPAKISRPLASKQGMQSQQTHDEQEHESAEQRAASLVAEVLRTVRSAMEDGQVCENVSPGVVFKQRPEAVSTEGGTSATMSAAEVVTEAAGARSVGVEEDEPRGRTASEISGTMLSETDVKKAVVAENFHTVCVRTEDGQPCSAVVGLGDDDPFAAEEHALAQRATSLVAEIIHSARAKLEHGQPRGASICAH